MTDHPTITLREDSLSPSTDRAFAIIETLARHPHGISVADLTRELGISQNSVFRITATLHERGYLHRRESDKKYLLSNKLFDLGRPRVNDKSLAGCAYEPMRALSRRTGETCQLLVRSGDKCVVLEQVTGSHPVKVMGEIGLRVPMYSCAPGKAILAWLPEEDRSAWLARVELKQFTAATLADKAALIADLDRARQRGYSVDRAEGLEGIHCAAAPIFNNHHHPVAAITVMAPVFRFGEADFPRFGAECIAAAREIQDRLAS